MRKEIEGRFDGGDANGAMNGNSETSLFDQYDKYPLSVLRGPMDKLPTSIDPLLKEVIT